MVVNEDKALCELLAGILSPYFEVIQANDGEEALALARKHSPRVVVADITFPEMSGVDLISALRSYPETRGVNVLLTSPSPENYQPGTTSKTLEKPFNIEVLIKILQQFDK